MELRGAGPVALLTIVVVLAACMQAPTASASTPSPPAAPAARGHLDSAGRFGFVSVGAWSDIASTGAGWARPMPGSFAWGRMQPAPGGALSFGATDSEIQALEANHLSPLVTLWPYAEWDQSQRPDAALCRHDDFLSFDITAYRCAPHDWAAYDSWVVAVVRRYDTTGPGAAPGLVAPVVAWEVDNEVDLKPVEADGLEFFIGQPAEYAELLEHTYADVHSVEPAALVLISAPPFAPDGISDPYAFFRAVLSDPRAATSFDVGNMHCLDCIDSSLNVTSYEGMLHALGLSKPVWVTEALLAETSDQRENLTLLKLHSAGAFTAGAGRVFIVNPGNDVLTATDSRTQPPNGLTMPAPDDSIPASDPIAGYKAVIASFA